MKTLIAAFILCCCSVRAETFTIYADQNHFVTFDISWPTNQSAVISNALWQVLNGATNQLAVANTNQWDIKNAALNATNALGSAAFTSSILYDAAGAARNATNGLGSAAFNNTSFFALATNAIVSKSANYTIQSTDSIILMNGALSATLPSAVGLAGKDFTIKCVSAGTNAILTASAQTIDGAGKWTNTALNKFTRVVSDGANWKVIGSN